MSKLANLGTISAFLGLLLLIALPIGSLGLYSSSLFLLLGSILGLAYTLRPKLKLRLEDMALIVLLEFLAFVASFLKYFKTIVQSEIFSLMLFVFIPFVLMLSMLALDAYRNRE